MNTVDRIDVADVITEFIRVVIENILFTRKLYPKSIFVEKRIYGIVVQQSEHPLLNEYLSKCMEAVHFHTKRNQLHKVIVNVKSGRNVIEAFVFEALQLVNNYQNNYDLVSLRESLRSACLKLAASSAYLGYELSWDAEFDVELHINEASALAFNEDHQYDGFPWAQINPRRHHINPPEILPLHTVDTENIVMQIYVEKFA